MAKKTKKSFELSFKVERSNELNQLRPRGLTLTEIRFLAIYQAKINARNPETGTVIFSLAEFCNIMGVENLNVTHIKNVADDIICKPVHLPSTSGKNGFTAIPLFNECEVYQDYMTGEWLVKIECHPKALPYMFEMKKNYFTYELWNALKLKSVNQLRIYEILKQYEKIGERTIVLDELKDMLGIDKNSQVKYQDFRRDVLEVCQKALEQYTDIKYTFEPIRRGRKIYALKFIITKNKDFKDDLRLKEFIKPEDLADINEDIPIQIEKPQEKLVEKEKSELSSTFDGSYLPEQLESLLDIAKSVSDNPEAYLKSIYYQIKARGKKVSNLYSYTLAIINADLKNVKPKENRKSYSYDDYEDKPSYDLDAYIEYNRRMMEMIAEEDEPDDFDEIFNSDFKPF